MNFWFVESRILFVIHESRTLNSYSGKFAISLQYLKREVEMTMSFLHADKHQSFLLGDLKNLGIKIS